MKAITSLSALSNKLTGWGTAAGATLTALSLAVSVIVYQVRTADNVTHCLHLLDYHEVRFNRMEQNLDKIRDDVGYLRGRSEAKPEPHADQQASK